MATDELRSVTGTVFNIQHYCIHDGPGIRTNVFVKGCPLRCQWCANPESWSAVPQLMYLADRCTGCGRCVDACPSGSVARSATEPDRVVTDRAKCTACAACAALCPAEARSVMGEVKTAGEVFDAVAGDRLFYGSDGGMTVTGGEAFAQPRFTGALIRLCRQEGISTAVETCGHTPWDTMEPILRDTDLVLFDIKQMDSARHRAYTGVGNELILENLTRISHETNCKIILRCPVIPPCNDGTGDMEALALFLTRNQIRCSEVNLLPYHNLGEGKRGQLESGTEGFVSHTPSDQEMVRLREVFSGHGYTVK